MSKTMSEFMSAVTGMYGAYKKNPGMAASIEKELYTCTEVNLGKLWELVKEQHSKNFPPTYYEIKSIAERGRIAIYKSNTKSVYVCGHCLSEFEIESGFCINPQCETRGMSLPKYCPWCLKNDVTTKFDDSQEIKTLCPVCQGIRTIAMIRSKQ